jgi:hypothetical protein
LKTDTHGAINSHRTNALAYASDQNYFMQHTGTKPALGIKMAKQIAFSINVSVR